MRSNANKLIRNVIDKRIAGRKETKDCVIWQVVPQNRKARVRIQGSSKDIWASYPQSWEETPPWLKAGNVARINFTGGIRGRIELVGVGHLRPTPYDGTDAMPDTGAADDDLLSGGLVYPIPLNNRMAVYVRTGTYRINEITYTLGPKVMGVGDDMILGDGCPLGITAAVVDIDSCASGYFRTDLIVVGTDGVVDYVKGTAATSSPVTPSVPSDHILLNSVFVHGGLTAITYNEIGQTYAEPTPCGLRIVVDDDEITWSDSTPYTYIYVYPVDQYGNNIGVEDQTYVNAQMMVGTGTLEAESGSTTETGVEVGGYIRGIWTQRVRFKYTSDHTVDDESPYILFELANTQVSISGYTKITLLDALGEELR